MDQNIDFEFFRRSLKRRRRLLYENGDEYAYAVDELFRLPRSSDRPRNLWRRKQPPPAHVISASPVWPKYVWHGKNGYIVDTANYARQPGSDLAKLRNQLDVCLPEDFAAFHREFSEALIVTCGGVFHVWSEEQILDKIERYRDNKDKAARFFRFASYFDEDQYSFGLWNENPETNTWRVVGLASAQFRDQHFDVDSILVGQFFTDHCGIVGASFMDWLAEIIMEDGNQRYSLDAPEDISELDPADPLPDGRVMPLGG